jgi:hypothetical protein
LRDCGHAQQRRVIAGAAGVKEGQQALGADDKVSARGGPQQGHGREVGLGFVLDEGVGGEGDSGEGVQLAGVVFVAFAVAAAVSPRKEGIQLNGSVTEADEDGLGPGFGEGEVGRGGKSRRCDTKSEAAVACQ